MTLFKVYRDSNFADTGRTLEGTFDVEKDALAYLIELENTVPAKYYIVEVDE